MHKELAETEGSGAGGVSTGCRPGGRSRKRRRTESGHGRRLTLQFGRGEGALRSCEQTECPSARASSAQPAPPSPSGRRAWATRRTDAEDEIVRRPPRENGTMYVCDCEDEMIIQSAASKWRAVVYTLDRATVVQWSSERRRVHVTCKCKASASPSPRWPRAPVDAGRRAGGRCGLLFSGLTAE